MINRVREVRGWSTRAQIALALLVGAVPLIIVVAIVAVQLTRNVPQARKARAEIQRDFEAIRAVTAVDEAIQDAERGQRGFLITGRKDYLDPYEDYESRGLLEPIYQSVLTLEEDDNLPRARPSARRFATPSRPK
jgi:CHASE3 domain sensor protein